jgi:hypothetical protein
LRAWLFAHTHNKTIVTHFAMIMHRISDVHMAKDLTDVRQWCQTSSCAVVGSIRDRGNPPRPNHDCLGLFHCKVHSGRRPGLQHDQVVSVLCCPTQCSVLHNIPLDLQVGKARQGKFQPLGIWWCEAPSHGDCVKTAPKHYNSLHVMDHSIKSVNHGVNHRVQ